ncbi:MAG TPA: acyl-CoA thioesterase [Flavitalea sp.]|nr:acyl-CoA thioesterase [Flavitalea sp.]
MPTFSKKISLRWADLDPNFHLRHSVYYDFGAELRVEILEELGLTLQLMKDLKLGPVLFREECLFRREIRLSDTVTINAKVSRLKPDGSRWSIRHEFLSADNKLMAVITVDGAWIDTALRKLVSPIPPIVKKVFDEIPKTDDFVLG